MTYRGVPESALGISPRVHQYSEKINSGISTDGWPVVGALVFFKKNEEREIKGERLGSQIHARICYELWVFRYSSKYPFINL